MAPKVKAKTRGASKSPSPAHNRSDPEMRTKAGDHEEVPLDLDLSESIVKGAAPCALSVEAIALRAEEEDRLVDVFRKFDLNGNGLVEVTEMKLVLHSIDPDVWSNDKLDSLFEKVDFPGGDSIQYEQFLKWILSGSIAQEPLLACDNELFWKGLGEDFETVAWQPSSNAELSEDGRCVTISSKGRISCLAGLLVPPVGTCSWIWRIKSSPTDTRRSFLDIGILLEGGDMASNSICARLAPPGSSIITACGTLLDGDVAAELDLEVGVFKIRGLGASGPSCDLLAKEESASFLLNGVGTLCGQLWRPFIFCNNASGISIELLDYQVKGRAKELLRTGVSAGLGDAASKMLLGKWLPGSGGQPGPGIGDIQCILPRKPDSGRGALYICAAATVTDRNLAHVGVSAMLRLGKSFASRHVPGGVEAKVIGIDDNPSENFGVHIDDCNAFIDGHIQDGRNVLVHCGAGVSRSGAAAVAYVMMAECLSYKDALALVKKARSWVRPNDGFQEQLKDYQKRLEMSGHRTKHD